MSIKDLTSLRPVLYADDDENDVFFMRRAFKKAGIINPLLIAENGARAMEIFRSLEQVTTGARPVLAILDLKMPHFSGPEVVRWARTQPGLKDLAMLLLTSSTQERDLRDAYEAGANGYLVKPADPDALVGIVSEIRTACLVQSPSTGWLKMPSNRPPPTRSME